MSLKTYIAQKFFTPQIQKEIKNDAAILSNAQVRQFKAELGFGHHVGGVLNNFGGGGEKWAGGLAASGSVKRLNHRLLRRNARKAYHESLGAKAIVDRTADTVADSGLKINPQPDIEILGLTMEQAAAWTANVKARFNNWAMDQAQNRSEKMNFLQAHRLYSIQQSRDGEVFCRLYYSKDKNLQNPLQFQFIDPDQIRGDEVTNTSGFSSRSSTGIELDSRGREKTYNIWVRKEKTPNQFDKVKIPAKGTASGRRFMLHGMAIEYADQTRGFSRLAHALQEFENITDFKAAEVKKAIIQSSLTMFTESKSGPASNPWQDNVSTGGAGPAAENFIKTGVASEVEPLDTDSTVSYQDLPEATIGAPGSVGVFNLNKDETLKPFQNTSPTAGFDQFVDSIMSYLSASMSIPLEVVLMKFNQNYSASRASLILFYRVAGIWRNEMASDFLNPIYEAWLSEEIGAGRIQAPGWQEPVLKAAWKNTAWVGAPMPNIDPMRTAKADQIYATTGAKTLATIAHEVSGSEFANNKAILNREFEGLAIPPWDQKPGASAGGNVEEMLQEILDRLDNGG